MGYRHGILTLRQLGVTLRPLSRMRSFQKGLPMTVKTFMGAVLIHYPLNVIFLKKFSRKSASEAALATSS